MSLSVKDQDRGYRDLLVRLKKAKTSVSVGILQEEGAQEHGKTTVLDVATYNEFGLGVPERSFLRAWFDLNHKTVREQFSKLMRKVVKGLELQNALDQLGLWMVGSIQKRITEHIPPPNAESTKKRKGSDVPLIDTGQLRSSVTHRVERLP